MASTEAGSHMTEETLKPVAYKTPYFENGRNGKLIPIYADAESTEAVKDEWEPLVRLSDAQAILAEKDKRIGELERERDEATGTLRYCEKQWSDERGVMIDKFVYERNRADAIAEAAERQLSEIAGHMDSECDSDSILHGIREAEADRDIYKTRATAAEAEAARLRALLAEAREVVRQFAETAELDIGDSEHDDDLFKPMSYEHAEAGVLRVKHFRAALALAEKLEKETGNE